MLISYQAWFMRSSMQAPAYNEYQRRQQAHVDLNQPVVAFRELVLAWPQRAPGMNVNVKHVRQADLPPHVFPDGAHISWLPLWQQLTASIMCTPAGQQQSAGWRSCWCRGRLPP